MVDFIIPRKTCSFCKQEFSLTHFTKRKAAHDGLNPQCRDCIKRYAIKHRDDGREAAWGKKYRGKQGPRNFPISVESKTCKFCKQSYPASMFHRHRYSPDGLKQECKRCRLYIAKKQRQTPAWKKYQLKWQREHLRIKTLAYDAKLEAQGGGCKICGTPPRPNRRLAIDHCHSSERVRVCSVRTATQDSVPFVIILTY